jgi:enamine deaminase RidA (YjgF/YER057c/UK114 family)
MYEIFRDAVAVTAHLRAVHVRRFRRFSARLTIEPLRVDMACAGHPAAACRSAIRRETMMPTPVPPYATARSGPFVFTSGVVADRTVGGDVSAADDALVQARSVLRGVLDALAEHGCQAKDVLRVECFLSAPEHFASWNTSWTEVFAQDPPTRTTVVTDLVSREYLLEAQAVAVLPQEAK